jgi:hypothetical protein
MMGLDPIKEKELRVDLRGKAHAPVRDANARYATLASQPEGHQPFFFSGVT